MMKSMTGFGTAESVTDRFIFKAEIKALNGKNLEVNFRMPRFIQDREIELRNRFMARLERGTVTISVNAETRPGYEQPTVINESLLKNYYTTLSRVAGELGADKHDVFRCALLMPDVTKTEDRTLNDEDWQVLLQVCERAFESFDKFREVEGQHTSQILLESCLAIEEKLPPIELLEQERNEQVRNRLNNSLAELSNKADYDKNRFEQELIYYLEKWDIHEEKSRLLQHCRLFRENLKEASTGKRLGFISQEMGREINTLGSKANHAGIQQLVVGMKEHLEKIKELLFNII